MSKIPPIFPESRLNLATAFESSCSSRTWINTDPTLSDLQFSQVMSALPHVELAEPLDAFQHCLFTRSKLESSPSAMSTRPSDHTWLGRELKKWTSSQTSSVSAIGTRFYSCTNLCVFYADLIEILWRSKMPVIWALKVDYSPYDLSIIDLLKYIILQALRLNPDKTENPMAQSYRFMYQSAVTENDWLDLLGFALSSLPFDQVCVVMDLQIINSITSPSPKEDFRWSKALANLLKKLSEHGVGGKALILVNTRIISHATFTPPSQYFMISPTFISQGP